MEITGKIIYALPEVSGVSKAGNQWKKREYVLQTQETYPKNIFFDFFGERADQFPLQVGQMVKLSFDIESREYPAGSGRWFTSIRGWKAEDPNMAPVQQPVQPMGQPTYAQASAPQYQQPGSVPPPPPVGDTSDDLPF